MDPSGSYDFITAAVGACLRGTPRQPVVRNRGPSSHVDVDDAGTAPRFAAGKPLLTQRQHNGRMRVPQRSRQIHSR